MREREIMCVRECDRKDINKRMLDVVTHTMRAMRACCVNKLANNVSIYVQMNIYIYKYTYLL